MTTAPSIMGKVALVTGASSGIGRAIAVKFASQGCQLAMCDKDAANLELTKAHCMEKGLSAESILLVIADLKNRDDIQRIMEETIAFFNQLDILVNNAGILKSGQIDAADSMDKYNEIMQVNLHSIVQLTHLAVPYLEKTKGCIVNTSSVAGFRGFPNLWAYCMTKAAVDKFCQCLAIDLGPRGIRVNNVNPGAMVTNIHKRAGYTDEEYSQFLEVCRSKHALERVGEVEEVSSVVSFLVSDRSSRTTGASLLIDGGRHAMVYRQPPEHA